VAVLPAIAAATLSEAPKPHPLDASLRAVETVSNDMSKRLVGLIN
jgi:hypothetical protein